MDPKLKQLFANDPEMLHLLETKAQTALLDKIVKANMEGLSVKGVSMIKGDKGDKGDTPQKYVDYFTELEVEQLATFLKETVKDEVRPIKGVDYFDGVNGKDGKDGKDGKNGRDGRDGRDGKDAAVLDTEGLVAEVIRRIPVTEMPTLDEIVREIKKKKLIELRDIKNMPLNMNDMRWHGGGLSTVSHDDTLTGNGTPSSPLGVVGGGVTVETPVGTVNAVNTIFTVTAEPKWVVSDSATYFNGAGYTYAALTITLDIPPSQYIRAII